MGGGLAFLTKKSFNPANWSNQKQVWEARQKDEIEKRRIAERDSQLRREREEEDLARVVGGEEAQGRKALSFMYEAGKVPGLDLRAVDTNSSVEVVGGYGSTVDRSSGTSSLFERQPGDDDAAAAFRAMLARGTLVGDPPDSSLSQPLQDNGETKNSTTSISDVKEEDAINEARDRDLRTNLEKAVGRGITSGSGVTLAQQMERFPMLKGAPRVLPKSSGGGDDGKESSENDVVGLNFKPLGQVLRNVKCLKCGVWGHSMGDRECGVSGWNPFAAVPVADMESASPIRPPMTVAAVPAAAPTDSAGTSNDDPLERKQCDEKGVKKPSSPERTNKKRTHKRRHHTTGKDGKRHHKRRKSGGRHYDRSPSYSSYSDSSSFSSRRGHHHKPHHHRRKKHYSDDENSTIDQRHHRSRKDSSYSHNGHRSSSRRHERTHSSSRRHKRRDRRSSSRSRSRSPSTSE